MNADEEIAKEYLYKNDFSDIQYEPSGNIPPDFLLNKKIAIEVRRLNQHDFLNQHDLMCNKGLEEISIPLDQGIRSLLKSFGPAKNISFYVSYDFKRPLEAWTELKPKVRESLYDFKRKVESQTELSITKHQISKNFKIEFTKSSKIFDDFYSLGSKIDYDQGGWIVPEMIRNINYCIKEKSKKITALSEKYSEWWLILVDHIDNRLHSFEREEIKNCVEVDPIWKKIILVSRNNVDDTIEIH